LLLKNESTIIKGIKAIIFDDTFLEKTGIKTEKVSRTFDHVSGFHLFGFEF